MSDFEIKLQNLLETYDPVLVGIGPCITTQLRALQIIARCCLTIYGDDRVYAGGPLASIDGQEWLFFELLRIRYIVKGDGEEAICQMIRCLKNGGSLAQCNYVSRSGYLLQTLKKQDEEYLSANVVKGFCKEEIYKGKSAEVIREKYPQKMLEKMKSLGVSEELILWYHIDTLNELLQLYELASSDQDIGMLSARKYAFVSILKEVCSQRGHFTYALLSLAER